MYRRNWVQFGLHQSLVALCLVVGCQDDSAVQSTTTLEDIQPDAGTDVTATEDTKSTGSLDTEAPPDTAPEPDITPVVLDTTPPTWPQNAALSVTSSTSSQITVAWPSALDDSGVTAYWITLNGEQPIPLGSTVTSHTFTGLALATDYALSVSAADSQGNQSEPLTVTAQTLDHQAPTWPASSSLSVLALSDNSASLSWTAANDNVKVTEYRIMNGNTVLATTQGNTTVTLNDLTAWQSYNLNVSAADAAGNIAPHGPSTSFQTPDSQSPFWADTAVLETSDVTPYQLTLSWPSALDNAGITGYELLRNQVVMGSFGATTLSTTVTELQPYQSYTFSIRARDAAGNTSTNNPQTTVKTSDTEVPTWPIGASVIASQVTPETLHLAWTPATDDVAVALYRITQNGVEIGTATDTQLAVSNLSPWTSYTFGVTAEDGAGNASLLGPQVTVQTTDTVAPVFSSSAALVANAVTPQSLVLSWDAATDDVAVTGYRVTRGTDILATLPADTLTFTVNGLSPFSVYAFRVEATDAAGNWSTSGPFMALQTPDNSPPHWGDVGGSLVASQITPTTLHLAWWGAQDDVGVVQYRVTLNGNELTVVDSQISSLNVTNLSPWTDYTFAIQAMDAANNWSTQGPSTTVKTTDWISPTWPVGSQLVVTNLEAKSLTLSWPVASDDVGIATYEVTLTDGSQISVPGTATSIDLTELQDGVIHTLWVIARDAAGNASPSLFVSAETPDYCYDDLQQFEEEIWKPFMSNDCAGCHTSQGLAAGTQFVLNMADTEEALAANFETVLDLALNQSKGGSLLLLKPTGQIPHMGGQRFYEGTEIYDSFLELIGRSSEPGGCIDPSDNYTCDKLPINPGPSHLRRLTSVQYHNTIHDLFNGLIDSGADFPKTVIEGGFSSYQTPNLVSVSGTQSIFDSTEKIGAQVIEHIDQIITCTDQTDLNCAIDFIKDFGLKAYRRPVTNGELNVMFGIYQQAPYNTPFAEKIARLVEVFIQSPQFLYIHAEEGAPVDAQPGVVALSHFAMASRLSYLLWDSMPDQTLFDRAAADSLNTPQVITEEVTRMLQDPRAQAMVTRFHNEWMHLYKVDKATKNPDVYPEFTPTLAAAMAQETDLLVKHVIFDGDGLFETLMTTTTSFVNQELGAIYGVDASLFAAGGWVQTTLDANRPGLLTRAAFSTAHSYPHASSPIHRGHFILQDMLCQKLVIPPINIGDLPEAPQGTIKDRLAMHREDPVCSSCHERMDPLGLAFEHYDGIGKWRDTYANEQPVDPTGVLENPALDFGDAVALTHQLSALDMVDACYAKQWFRYATGRGDQPQDKCSIESVQKAFQANGGNVLGLIHAITQSDSFRYRWDGTKEANND